jgi:hypothetical protein
MISTSIILSTGEKKWMPMKFFGRFEFCASAGDRNGRGVGGEDRRRLQHGLGLFGRSLLDLGILEHRLDHQIAAVEIGIVGRRRDQRQQLVLVFGFRAPFLT